MASKVNKADILQSTHYGLEIYAHVLRQHYPDETVLRLSGRDCGLCRNPFASGDANLHIWIEKSNPGDATSEELARHHDNSGTIPDGDAFAFAQQHYHLSGDELLARLAQDLHLVINKRSEFWDNEPTPTETRCTPGPNFTFFRAPVSNTKPYKDITLYDAYLYIRGHKAQKRTEYLRGIKDSVQARRYKASVFDYCCFSGTFSRRSESALIQHSGLMCIDFDHLPYPEDLRQQLFFDRYFETQLVFHSPSGDGLKWVIPIDLSKCSHSEYFDAVSNYILKSYGVQIDKSGRDVCRACFLPHDDHAYLNPKYMTTK